MPSNTTSGFLMCPLGLPGSEMLSMSEELGLLLSTGLLRCWNLTPRGLAMLEGAALRPRVAALRPVHFAMCLATSASFACECRAEAVRASRRWPVKADVRQVRKFFKPDVFFGVGSVTACRT